MFWAWGCFSTPSNPWTSGRVAETQTHLARGSIRFHRSRARSFKTAPTHHSDLCFWPTDYKSVSHDPLLSWVQLIFWSSSRTQETSLDHWFSIKGCNSETARWERCIGPGMGNGPGASTPSPGAPLSPYFHVLTKLEALWTICFWASLHSYSWLNHWPVGMDWAYRLVGGTASSRALITQLVLLKTSPCLGASKNHLIHRIKDIFTNLII